MNDSLKDALARLPHGKEFRFVDRLLTLDPGKEATGEYQLRGDEAFLQGHFPGYPLMPGVLLIEAAAQLAGTIAQCDPQIPPMDDLRLTAVRGAKILGSARPGETIHIKAQISGRMGNLVSAQAEARVGDRVILTTNVTLSGQPAGYNPEPPPEHGIADTATGSDAEI